ncbi:MAG: hypothetical protein Q4E83_01270 [bacterium]|nr:hypothetical protein [bacterium]
MYSYRAPNEDDFSHQPKNLDCLPFLVDLVFDFGCFSAFSAGLTSFETSFCSFTEFFVALSFGDSLDKIF